MTANWQVQGYKNRYQYDKARLAKQGTTPRRARNKSERARGIRRDYWAESHQRELKAQREGFRNAYDAQKARKLGLTGKAAEQWAMTRTLADFGVSKSTFDKVRRENRQWAKESAFLHSPTINHYMADVDSDIHNWSERRVGYILSYHAAIVNPRSNYDSLAENPDYKGPESGVSRKLGNKEQFFYLVKYANLMQVDEYEARYGLNGVATARVTLPKP